MTGRPPLHLVDPDDQSGLYPLPTYDPIPRWTDWLWAGVTVAVVFWIGRSSRKLR